MTEKTILTPEALKELHERAKLSQRISEAYSRDVEKPELVAFKHVVRTSRKYGFPIVCTLEGEEKEQWHWAACLLLEVANSWPREDIPHQLIFVEGSALFRDAKQLLSNGIANLDTLQASSSR